MKTAEDIFESKFPDEESSLDMARKLGRSLDYEALADLIKERAIQAMEEYASERTANLKELVKAHEHLLDCFGITKPEKSTHIDSLDAAFKRITELNNNLK